MRPSSSVTPSPTSAASAVERDAHTGGRAAALGVEHVGRERHSCHSRRACLRCSRAISCTSAPTSDPPRTTGSAADEQRVDAVRAAEDEVRDEVVGAAELEAVGAPDRDVGALAGLERADVVAPQHGGAAARREPQRVARGQRAAAAAAPRHEQRLLHLEEQIAALVRRGAVDAEPDAHARVEQVAHRRDPGAEPQVRRRAVRDADAGAAERRDVRRRRGGRSARTTRPGRSSRPARGTRPACTRTARGSTRPPRASRRDACAAAATAAARARPTPPSAAS